MSPAGVPSGFSLEVCVANFVNNLLLPLKTCGAGSLL